MEATSESNWREKCKSRQEGVTQKVVGLNRSVRKGFFTKALLKCKGGCKLCYVLIVTCVVNVAESPRIRIKAFLKM